MKNLNINMIIERNTAKTRKSTEKLIGYCFPIQLLYNNINPFIMEL